jgi:hypothetical protein
VGACGPHPYRFQVDLVGSEVERRDANVFVYFKRYCSNMPTHLYFKKNIIAICSITSADLLLLCCIAATDQSRPLVQCDHNSDRIIATGHLPVTIAHS